MDNILVSVRLHKSAPSIALCSVWQCNMDSDVGVSKHSFGDTLLAGVRQHLQAVSRNLEVCEMLEIG